MGMEFMGYQRADGRVGIRNHFLILPTVVCAVDVAQAIAKALPGSVCAAHESGCAAIIKSDRDCVERTLRGFATNPNVGACLLVSLGCEDVDVRALAADIKRRGKPVRYLIIQETKGVTNTIREGIRIGLEMMEELSKQKRCKCDLADIVFGLECGGSDTTSGIAANPAIGLASDMLLAVGGTSIITETPEHIGGEQALTGRGETEEVREKFFAMIKFWENMAKKNDTSLCNLSLGNLAGGLSTSEEKSLGCIMKAGTACIKQVVEYGEVPTEKGLIVMDGPGADLESLTGLAAAGAQVIVFSSGKGTPTGCPIVPVIKMTGNPQTYDNLEDCMDINAGRIILGDATIAEIGQEIFDRMVAVCNGQRTKAELLGFGGTSIMRRGFTY